MPGLGDAHVEVVAASVEATRSSCVEPAVPAAPARLRAWQVWRSTACSLAPPDARRRSGGVTESILAEVLPVDERAGAAVARIGGHLIDGRDLDGDGGGGRRAAGCQVHNLSNSAGTPSRACAVLNSIISVGRSLPFLILMAAIMPVTRFLIGTTIGIPAAIVPMTLAGVPFFAQLVENSPALVRWRCEMARVSGGSTLQMIRTVQL